ncbi:unnamed protein product [Mytilus coruscus]|uniref:Uncharacterized protein n=1 Tax=Mytilus coruscus TaxID=42192 RepID=A0A6J8EJN5_MYTCO|nr:unnamed protein product [Mytilus coruscus]
MLRNDLLGVGFLVNEEKSQHKFKNGSVLLGLLRDGYIDIPSHKLENHREKVINIQTKTHVLARELASVVDSIISLKFAYGSVYTTTDRCCWKELEKFRNHSDFSKTVQFLPDVVKNSKAAATNKKCDNYFSKFQHWCLKYNFCHLPASVSTVAVFLGGLIQQKVSQSVLEAYFYSINWHQKLSLKLNPCADEFLTLI